MEKIKVIHVLTDRNVGGAGRWLQYYLRHFDRKQFDCAVLLPPESCILAPVKELGVRTLFLPEMQEASWDAGSLMGMLQLFRKEKPQVVHTHASLTARLAAKLAGVPVIVASKHCMENPGGGVKNILRGLINRHLTSSIIAVSDAVGESLVQGGTDRDKICRIYNGIQPAAFTEEESRALAESLGMDKEHLWVGIVARMEPVKGVDIFLQAALKLLETRRNVRFLICGLGSQERMLREMAKPYPEDIVFAGYQPKVEQLMAQLDLLAVSSRQEALCLSALEGLAAGVPAVGTRVGGIPEVIRPGETGLLVPPEDPDALAQAMAALLDDEPLRRKMGETGKQMVQTEYSAAVMTQQVEQLYLRLLERK